MNIVALNGTDGELKRLYVQLGDALQIIPGAKLIVLFSVYLNLKIPDADQPEQEEIPLPIRGVANNRLVVRIERQKRRQS